MLTLHQNVVSELKFYLLNWVAIFIEKSSVEKQMAESWMEFWSYS